jgi:hypothetical protein
MNEVKRYELLLRQPKIYMAQAISLRDPRKKNSDYFMKMNKRQLAQWIVEQERIFKKDFITLYKKNNE